jgi:hypothetical protein
MTYSELLHMRRRELLALYKIEDMTMEEAKDWLRELNRNYMEIKIHTL